MDKRFKELKIISDNLLKTIEEVLGEEVKIEGLFSIHYSKPMTKTDIRTPILECKKPRSV